MAHRILSTQKNGHYAVYRANLPEHQQHPGVWQRFAAGAKEPNFRRTGTTSGHRQHI